MSKGTKIHLAAGLALLSILALPKQGGAADGNPGKDLFDRRCSGCHALDKDKEGPRLRGVFGRASAAVPDYQYSEALKAIHVTWNAAILDRWLTDPEKLAPNNDMAFQLVNADERAAIIAYLKSLTP